VGTKHDLESDREVNTAEIEEYAKERGLPWVETSAKTNRNVEEAFAMVIRLVREKRNPKVEEKPRHIKPCVIQ
jgi:GTPase SAR1 family protein